MHARFELMIGFDFDQTKQFRASTSERNQLVRILSLPNMPGQTCAFSPTPTNSCNIILPAMEKPNYNVRRSKSRFPKGFQEVTTRKAKLCTFPLQLLNKRQHTNCWRTSPSVVSWFHVASRRQDMYINYDLSLTVIFCQTCLNSVRQR